VGRWWIAGGSPVAVQREAVDAEGEGQQVEVLALVTDGVGSP